MGRIDDFFDSADGGGDSGGLTTFINGSESDAVGFPIVNQLNPVKWGSLASTIVGSIVAGAASSVIAVPNGIAAAISSVYEGGANVTEQVIGTFFEPLVTVPLGISESAAKTSDWLEPGLAQQAAAQIWATAYIAEFGLLAGPLATALVLGAVLIVAVGARQAIESFRSGGGVL